MTRRALLAALSIVMTIGLLAGACSSTDSTNRNAASAAGDPTTLPALLPSTGGGQLIPAYYGSEITPSTWVSTSLSPTLVVPGGTGAWTFTLDDLSDGQSGFGPRVYAESGSTARIPEAAGLQQGRVYLWTAESPGQQGVGGTFQVDVQMPDAQETDSVGGLVASLSSGESSFSWSSHSMNSIPGKVGFGLTYQGSNIAMPGVPAGWRMQVASSSQFQRIQFNGDKSVSLIADNGVVSAYREGAEGSFIPVQLSGGTLNTNGLSPVLLRDAKGNYTVTTKDTTSVFAPNADGTFADLVSVNAGDKPVLGQTSTDGRVQTVSDPVSGRKIEFIYGGGSCPNPVSGFVAAPAGKLCQVKFWDGSTTALSYVATKTGDPTIGRIADYPEAGGDGAMVTDFSYDDVGHIAKVRSPLVASAAASNVISATDPQFLTTATYDGGGRVATMTEPASTAGANRCVRSYSYETNKFTVASDSCFGGQVASIVFDPTTFFATILTNSAGQESRRVWDFPSGQLLQEIDYNGLVTVRRYEGGQLVETRGPTKGSLAESQQTLKEYDKSFEVASDGIEMKGLDVTYWPSTTNLGVNGIQEMGPKVDGVSAPTLTVNWPKSPAGNNGEWSAVMTGGLRIDTAGRYSFSSGNSLATLRVNNILCTSGSCSDLELQPGMQSIRIDVSSPESQASMDILWSGPDAGSGGSIPVDRLRPQYGYATTTKVVDPTVRNANVESISKTTYDNPATGLVTSRTTQADAKTTLAYESGKNGQGGWGRQVSSTSPGGNSFTFSYWGDKETAKSACPGASSANQGGAAKKTTTPGSGGDGPSSTQWVDGAGRTVALSLSDGGTICTTYDKAGRQTKIELIGMGTKMVEETVYAVDGNPLIAQQTTTIGTETSTTRAEIDLLGRPVVATDRYGVQSRTTYDARTGEVATMTTTAPGAAPTVVANTYNERGWLQGVTVDGRAVATLTMDPDGTSKTIVYGNGVTSTNGYDDSNRLNAVSWVGPNGQTWSNSLEISAANNVSATSFTAGGKTSELNFTHDLGGHLSSATVSAGLVPEAKTWAYTFDANANRTSQKITSGGALTGDYTYTYDGADRLTGTNDPAASAGITYDKRGNATKVGPNTFTFDAIDRVIGATDGEITIAYERSVTGNIMSKTTTGGSDAGTIKYGLNGVMIDADGMARTQVQGLPGGVVYIRSLSGGASKWEFSSIDGDRFFTTDDSGAQQGAAQVYDPFGQLLTEPAPTEPTVPNLGWQSNTGNETQVLKTTYVMMGARVYIPALGRFIQLDPKVGGGANGYDYANQDPVNISDPSGESFTDWLPTIVVGVVSLVVSVFATPAAGFMVAAAINAVIGAASYAAIYLWERYGLEKDTEFSLKQMGISALMSGVLGGIGGRTQWTKAVKSAKALGAGDDAAKLGTMFIAKNAKSLNRAAALLKAGTVEGADAGSTLLKAADKTFVTKSRVAAVTKLFEKWSYKIGGQGTYVRSWEGVDSLYWNYAFKGVGAVS